MWAELYNRSEPNIINESDMNIDLIVIGKTDSTAINEIVGTYLKRLNFYTKFSIITIPDLKNTKNIAANSQKKQEGELILKQLIDSDWVVILDENGKEFKSMQFADWVQRKMNMGIKRLVFVVGGPYGFSEAIYDRSNEKISLSKMTFSHQIIRAIFTEQIYRAFTILNNEPYHHE